MPHITVSRPAPPVSAGGWLHGPPEPLSQGGGEGHSHHRRGRARRGQRHEVSAPAPPTHAACQADARGRPPAAFWELQAPHHSLLCSPQQNNRTFPTRASLQEIACCALRNLATITDSSDAFTDVVEAVSGPSLV